MGLNTDAQDDFGTIIDDIDGPALEITLSAVKDRAFSDEGDEVITYGKSTTPRAIIFSDGFGVLDHRASGSAIEGDLTAYFKSTVIIEIGQKLTYNNLEYTISEIDQEAIAGTIVYQKALLKRSSDDGS